MLYEFNETTGEYSMEIPFETEETENRTSKKPPEVDECEVAIFDKQTKKWNVVVDYRFKYMKQDESGNITPIETFGEIGEEYTLIEYEIAEKTLHNNNLHITKLDFFENICSPAGITYNELMAKIDEVGMRPKWEFCNHIYFGVIKPFLSLLPTGKTEEEIIEIFERIQNASKDSAINGETENVEA